MSDRTAQQCSEQAPSWYKRQSQQVPQGYYATYVQAHLDYIEACRHVVAIWADIPQAIAESFLAYSPLQEEKE